MMKSGNRFSLGIFSLFLVIALGFTACPNPSGGKTKIAKPALVENQFNHSGSPHTVELTGKNAAYTLGGDITKTDIGNYAATVTLTNTANYEWTDGTTAPLSLPWSIVSEYLQVNYDDPENIFGIEPNWFNIDDDDGYIYFDYKWDDPNAFDFLEWMEQHGYVLYWIYKHEGTHQPDNLYITLSHDNYGEGIHFMRARYYFDGSQTGYDFIKYYKFGELFAGTAYVESGTEEKIDGYSNEYITDKFNLFNYWKWNGDQRTFAGEQLVSLGWNTNYSLRWTWNHTEFEEDFFTVDTEPATYIIFGTDGFYVAYVEGNGTIRISRYILPGWAG